MSGRDVDKLRNKGIKVLFLFPNQCLKMAYFTRRDVAKVHSKYPCHDNGKFFNSRV